jgi:hypothetical protein
MALEVKIAKNSKLPKLSKNCFERVGKGGWPPISTWITPLGRPQMGLEQLGQALQTEPLLWAWDLGPMVIE